MRRIPDETKQEVIRLRVEERLGLSDIVEATGISQGSASLILRPFPLTKKEVGQRQQERYQRWRQKYNQTKDEAAAEALKALRTSAGTPIYGCYAKAHLAVLKVQERALQKGVIVSFPMIESRYDCILDVGGQLLRAQVKYADAGRPNARAVGLDLRKGPTGRGNPRPFYTAEEIDVLLVYVAAVDQVIWLGPDRFDHKSSLSLRFSPSPNKRGKRALCVADFVW